MSAIEPRYFRCRNWHKFQHYHGGKRGITWIKNYLEIDDLSHPFSKLTFAEQGRLQAIWRLAAKSDNIIPFDEKFVAQAIRAKRVPLGSLLADKWIEVGTREELKRLASAEKRAANRKKPASRALAVRYQKASLEKEVEKETPISPSGNAKAKCPECGLSGDALPKSSTMADHRWQSHGVEAIDGRAA